MAETKSKAPAKLDTPATEHGGALEAWRPFETMRREIDRFFGNLDRPFWMSPFRHSMFDMDPFWNRAWAWSAEPAVDIVEKEKAFEITADLPGVDEKNIEVKLINGGLTIKGEKRDEWEETKHDYHLHERNFGAFERYFALPDGVDADKVAATFRKGVLTVTLPKKAEALRPEKKIEVKAAA